MSEKAKNREEAKRVVSWELREASAMLLSAWKNTVSDFFPFLLFSLSKSTWKLFCGIEQVGVYAEVDWGREWAGLCKAAPSYSSQCTEVKDSEVQRPSGPELQPSWGFFYKTPKKTKTSNCRRTYKEPVSDCYIWMDSNNVITKPLNNVKHHLTFTKDKNVSYLININISVFISAGVFIM